MHVICSHTSGRRLRGTWDVTDVREGKEIDSDYTERFFQALHAEVCFVLKYDVVMKALIDVLPKWMRAYLHKVQQQVSDRHRQCCVLMVTSVMELLFSFCTHCPTDVRKRKTATASPAASTKNSAKPKAIPATGQELCMCSCNVYVQLAHEFIHRVQRRRER